MNGDNETPKTIFFDLHGTLYDFTPQIFKEFSDKIIRKVSDRYGIPVKGAEFLTKKYYYKYGSTVKGLYENHSDFDKRDVIQFFKDIDSSIDLSELKQDKKLSGILKRIKIDTHILTNTDRTHTLNALEKLGIPATTFKSIITPLDTLTTSKFHCKPEKQMFEFALKSAGARAESSIFVDDSTANIQKAYELGFTTILAQSCPGDIKNIIGADYIIRTIYDIEPILVELGCTASSF